VATIRASIDALTRAVQVRVDALAAAIQARIDPIAARIDMARSLRMAFRIQSIRAPIGAFFDAVATVICTVLDTVSLTVEVSFDPVAAVGGVGAGGSGNGEQDGKRDRVVHGVSWAGLVRSITPQHEFG
jgi:hypothetical protein